MAEKEFKIFGRRLGSPSGWLTVELTGITDDGTLEFQDGDARKYTLTVDNLESLHEEDLILPTSRVSAADDGLIEGIEGLNDGVATGRDRGSRNINDKADDALQSVFQAIVMSARE